MRYMTRVFYSIFALLWVTGCGDGGAPVNGGSASAVGGDASTPPAEATLPSVTPLVDLTAFNHDWGSVGVFTAATQCAQCH